MFIYMCIYWSSRTMGAAGTTAIKSRQSRIDEFNHDASIAVLVLLLYHSRAKVE